VILHSSFHIKAIMKKHSNYSGITFLKEILAMINNYDYNLCNIKNWIIEKTISIWISKVEPLLKINRYPVELVCLRKIS